MKPSIAAVRSDRYPGVRTMATGALFGALRRRETRQRTLVEADISDARILLIDDEDVNLLLLDRILGRAGFSNLCSTSDSREATALFDSFAPDLVCTDLHMPHMNGLEIIDAVMEKVPSGHYFPIAVLTADISDEAEKEALSRGARDFIQKPFKAHQIELRLRNLLETRKLHDQLRRHNEQLEELVLERTVELNAARVDALERLALAAEYRDYTTGRHTHRVGVLSALLAARLGFSSRQVDLVRRAAPLHDLGKIGIPDSILLKPGKLTAWEYDAIRGHVELGASLLAHGRSELIRLAEQIALSHHERWDGTGYPRGLRGDEIPLVGQIVALADVFDTLVHERPYKAAWSLEAALGEIRRLSGRWFAPHLVEAFFEVLDENQSALRELGISPTVHTV